MDFLVTFDGSRKAQVYRNVKSFIISKNNVDVLFDNDDENITLEYVIGIIPWFE